MTKRATKTSFSLDAVYRRSTIRRLRRLTRLQQLRQRRIAHRICAAWNRIATRESVMKELGDFKENLVGAGRIVHKIPSAAFGRKQRLNGPRIARIPRMRASASNIRVIRVIRGL